MLPMVEMDPDPMQEVELPKRGRPKKQKEPDPQPEEGKDQQAEAEGGHEAQQGVGAEERAPEDEDVACPFPQPSADLLGQDPPEVEVRDDHEAAQNFRQKVEELRPFGTRPITIAVPLSDRKDNTVVNAVAAMYARLRALQIPVRRIRADRAREFVSQKFKSWMAT